MVFRLQTEPVHIVSSSRPFVKALFHPQGIKDGYCINGYLRKNAGHERARVYGGARGDALLIWNVGGASGLPKWSSDSPYCRYDSDFNVFVTYPGFSRTREELRTLYWSYSSETQNLLSIEEGLSAAGYTKSASGWWNNRQALWTLSDGDQRWLTKYSVRIVDSAQQYVLWPIVQTIDPEVTTQLDATRSILATQPDALRLYEQAVDAWADSVQLVPPVQPVFVNPAFPFYWPVWPSPTYAFGILHPWQLSFLDALASQTVEAQP